jgi:deoxyribonuclease V
MTQTSLHPWTLDPDEAIQLQEDLRECLVLAWDGRVVNTIGGVDINYVDDKARVAITVLTFPDMTPLTSITSDMQLVFPYIPGLLAFRVGPAILAAWEKLELKPDLIMIHGHGVAHPRGIGLASHVGLWINLPTIGIAKTRVYGCHYEAGSQVGDWSELLDERDTKHVIGAVLRTKVNAKPIYVSPGHLIDLMHSIQLVMACCHGFRLPEPIRMAHQLAIRTRYLTNDKL